MIKNQQDKPKIIQVTNDVVKFIEENTNLTHQ